MKARKGRLHDKPNSPRIGRWLKWYFSKRTCKRGDLDRVTEMVGKVESREKE